MDGRTDRWMDRQIDGWMSSLFLHPFVSVLTNLSSHHSDVVPSHLLSVQNLSCPDDSTVHSNGKIQRFLLNVVDEVPMARCDIVKSPILNPPQKEH